MRITEWRGKHACIFNHNVNYIDKLAAYEDAEEQGRLVIMPCKVGDTVWVIGASRIVRCFIDEAYFTNNEIEYLVSFKCDGDCDGCPFDSWHQDYSGEYSCNGEYGNGTIRSTDFGKTVFLFHTEAEAALKGETKDV